MSYWLKVDVGSFTPHVFKIDDPMKARSAFNLLYDAIIPPGTNPVPTSVIVSLDAGELAMFRREDLRAVSLTKDTTP